MILHVPRLSCLFLTACLLLTTCQAAGLTTPSPAPSSAAPASATPAPADMTATPPRLQGTAAFPAKEAIRYTLDATLDESLRGLRVKEQITFANPGEAPLETLPLVVEANRYAGSFELVGASPPPGFTVTVESLDPNTLWLRLAPALPAGDTLTLTLEYELALPAIRPESPQVFGYTQRQINLAEWYPFLPVYNAADGWLIHPPGEVGEHTVYPVADFDVTLHLPQLEPALIVAAAAPAEPVEGGYRYRSNGARNFTWSASQEYRVSSQQAGDADITSYAYPATELAARAALDYTAQAVNYFSKQFNMPLRGSLSIVQADFPDGMEYDGLYFLSDRFYYGFDGSPRSYLALIAVHETAHQWWYARVGSDQAMEPWLDEALCTYSELLFYENLNPQLAAWWWSFRVEPYAPEGPLSASIYDFSQFLPYRNQVYLRGAQFIDALRGNLGDDAFFAGLQAYLRHYDGQIATRQGFLDTFQQAAGVDLAPLTADFFER